MKKIIFYISFPFVGYLSRAQINPGFEIGNNIMPANPVMEKENIETKGKLLQWPCKFN